MRFGYDRSSRVWSYGGDGVDALALGDSFFTESLNLKIIDEAFAIKILLEIVHRFNIIIKLSRCGLLLDFVEKTTAEISKANWGAIIWLIATGSGEEIIDIFGEDILPVGNIMTSDDGEDLFLAKVYRNLFKNVTAAN